MMDKLFNQNPEAHGFYLPDLANRVSELFRARETMHQVADLIGAIPAEQPAYNMPRAEFLPSGILNEATHPVVEVVPSIDTTQVDRRPRPINPQPSPDPETQNDVVGLLDNALRYAMPSAEHLAQLEILNNDQKAA